MQKPKDTPYELFALLLLTLPVELIYRKLVVLLTFGERNHQLFAEPPPLDNLLIRAAFVAVPPLLSPIKLR